MKGLPQTSYSCFAEVCMRKVLHTSNSPKGGDRKAAGLWFHSYIRKGYLIPYYFQWQDSE